MAHADGAASNPFYGWPMNETRTSPPAPALFGTAKVADYTSRGILACAPEAGLDEVAWLMANNGVHAIVVTDDRPPEPPVISDLDLVTAAESGHFETLTARDVAGQSAVCVNEAAPLAEAAGLLSRNRVSHLVVRDDARIPVGILSTIDLIHAVAAKR